MHKILKKTGLTGLWQATLLLLFILFGGLWLAYYHVTATVEKECNANLELATEQFTSDVQKYFQTQEIQLQALANLVAKQPDIRNQLRMEELLSTFNQDRLARHVQILYPENSCFQKVSLAEASQQDTYITYAANSELGNGKSVVQVMAPVFQAGRAVAMLCNTINLADMQDYFKVDIYGGKAQLFIVDGTTGQYLLDNWHNDLSNNTAMLAERKYHSGYSGEKFLADLRQGKQGQTLFKSKTTGEYLYTHYKPVGINNWQGVVSVLESDAMRPARSTTRIMTLLAAVYIVAFISFFGWILYMRRATIKEWEKLWGLDLNTGLENRNAYSALLSNFQPAAGRPVACVYVDVNGLHEMNNKHGHEAGDAMLIAVAAALQEIFTKGHLYRLGGDEFLGVFREETEESLNAKLQRLKTQLAQKNYSVSVGLAYDEAGQDQTCLLFHYR